MTGNIMFNERKDKDMMEVNNQKAYAGCCNAGAPVCIRFYRDVGQGSTEQRTQQLPEALNLKKTQHKCCYLKICGLYKHKCEDRA